MKETARGRREAEELVIWNKRKEGMLEPGSWRGMTEGLRLRCLFIYPIFHLRARLFVAPRSMLH